MMKFNEEISINDENYDRTMTNVSLVYSRYGMLPQLANNMLLVFTVLFGFSIGTRALTTLY